MNFGTVELTRLSVFMSELQQGLIQKRDQFSIQLTVTMNN